MVAVTGIDDHSLKILDHAIKNISTLISVLDPTTFTGCSADGCLQFDRSDELYLCVGQHLLISLWHEARSLMDLRDDFHDFVARSETKGAVDANVRP